MPVYPALPNNIYTQEDADLWMQLADFWLEPNPDWLKMNEPVATCFPASLVKPGMNVAEAVRRHPEWKLETYHDTAFAHNNRKDRAQSKGCRTTSQIKKVMIPRCLLWKSPVNTPRRPTAQQSGTEQVAEPSTSLALVPTTSTEGSGSIQAISQSCEKLATAVVHLVQSARVQTFTSGATVSEI